MDTELQCWGIPPQMSLISGPSLFKNLPIHSMISVLLFTSVVKGVEIGNSDSPGSLHRNFTRWNN